MSDNLVGKLLVATPLLHDPNFVRSVVLICQQNDDGYLGLILNRPLEDAVAEHLPEWEHLVSAPAQIFEGGPVQREVALALGRRTDGGEDSDDAGGWTAIGGELGLLDLRGTPSELWGAIEQLRIFSGYSGWGAGQLEGELQRAGLVRNRRRAGRPVRRGQRRPVAAGAAPPARQPRDVRDLPAGSGAELTALN